MVSLTFDMVMSMKRTVDSMQNCEKQLPLMFFGKKIFVSIIVHQTLGIKSSVDIWQHRSDTSVCSFIMTI